MDSPNTIEFLNKADGIQAEPSLVGAWSPEGVDRTLIKWSLAMTPAERLAAAQSLIDVAWAVRKATSKTV